MTSAYATSEDERYDDDQAPPFLHHVMFARPPTPEQSEAIDAVNGDRSRRRSEPERRAKFRQHSDGPQWHSRPSVSHTTIGAHTSGAQHTPSASSSTTQMSRSSNIENPNDPPPGPPAHGHSAGGAPNEGDQRYGNVTTAPNQGKGQDAPPRDMEAEKLAGEPQGWRRIVRNFTTPWFTVNMGTGMISILLYRVPQPYNARWLRILGIIVFILNLVLFIIFSAISTVRFILFPKVIGKVARCEKESLFLGAYVMGLATLVNMFVYVCVEGAEWGPWALNFAWAWFFVCAVLSFASVCAVPFLMITLHTHELPAMTGAWLMPVLPPVVVSGTGAIVATALANSPHHHPTHALWTILLSYFLWGAGIPLAFSLSAILLARLTLHRQLPSTDIVSMLIPIGPLGTGGFAIQTLGKVSRTTFPATGVLLGQTSGDSLYTFGSIIALIMWGYGIVWLTLAVSSMLYQRKFPFNMGWWSFVFPFGVFTLSTYTLGAELPSLFLKIVGIVFMVILVCLWIVVAGDHIRHTVSGDVFRTPWLRNELPRLRDQREKNRQGREDV